MTAAPQLIVFGGAFDPPHAAHQAAVTATLAAFPKAELWLVPGAAPAVAGGGSKAPLASHAQRLAMCECMCAALGPRVHVSAIEGSLPSPNYTITTLDTIAKQKPGVTLGLLIGQDQLAAFPRWREPHNILKAATLVVLGRQTSDASKVTSIDQAIKDLEVSLPEAKDRLITLVGIDVGPAASHLIRQDLERGQRPPAGWLAPEVESYIRQHALYEARKTQ